MTAEHAPPLEARPSALVIDASVAAKWLLRDEDGLAEADRLHDEHAHGRLGLVAPQQIEVEVSAAIRRAVLAERIDAATGGELLLQWLDELCPSIHLVANARLLPEAYETCLRYGVTLFDALYVTLANQVALDLITADERFLRSPAGRLPFVRSPASWSHSGTAEEMRPDS